DLTVTGVQTCALPIFAFEGAWRRYAGLPHAHFVASATAGLHLAVAVCKHARGWRDGDEVITTPLTFVSTNHVILHAGLRPVFARSEERRVGKVVSVGV